MNILDALRIKGIETRQYNLSDKDEYVLCCPFCPEKIGDEDLKYKLGFNIRSGDAHCFRCNWGFRRFGVKALAEKIDMLDVVDELGELPEKEEIKAPDNVDLPEGFDLLYPPPDDDDEWGQQAYKYLHSRHIKKWQIKKHKIGYCITGRYAFRIVLPVYWGKKLKGLVGRAFADQEPKYLNTPGMKCIYGIPKVKEHKVAILVEGSFDRYSIERALGPYNHSDTGALLGHSLTDFQLWQLKGYKTLILWPDGDTPGIKGMIKVAEQVKKDFELFWVHPRMGRDPGSLNDAKVLKDLKNAKLYTESLKMKMQALVAFEE
jgi:DNA primase